MKVSNEAHDLLEIAFFCDKYGWLPSEVMKERADILGYLTVIESARTQRRKRDESNQKK